MSANPHANGGNLRKPLHLPDFCDYAVSIDRPGAKEISPTETLGKFLRDVMRSNMSNFRLFSPHENAFNRLQDVYQASPKTWLATIKPEDADGTDIAPDGRVMEMLSEHTLEGWLRSGSGEPNVLLCGRKLQACSKAQALPAVSLCAGSWVWGIALASVASAQCA